MKRSAEEIARILVGITCTHRKMRKAACESCRARGVMCRWECPTCGLTWMWGEGLFG